MSKPYVLYINGMSCSSCSNAIKGFLSSSESLKNVESFEVDFTTPDPKKTTIVLAEEEYEDEKRYQITWTTISSLIEEIGFTCENYQYPPIEERVKTITILEPIPLQNQLNGKLKSILEVGKNIITSHWFLGGLGCTAGIALLILSIAMGGLPLAVMIPLASLSVLFTFVLGARSFYEAWNVWVKSRALTMDTLFAISTLSVLAVSIISFFVPWLPMMFEAGLLIYGFRHIGIAIEETIKEKISSSKFQDRAPKKVRLHSNKGILDTNLNNINTDDIIIVNPGEIIPIDGLCENESLIYNTIFKGAILPRYFNYGEKVLAGMRLAEDTKPLKIRVLKPAKDSYLARLDTEISKSIQEKAPIEVKTERILTYFIPAIIAIAIISGLVIGLFFTPALGILCAVSVLVSACPCTLGLIIPLAVKTGIQKAAEHGVLFKNSRILQETEQIDTVVFDLNGTLTTGIPVVKQYAVLDNTGLSLEHFMSLCAGLEEQSLHPVGKAIYSFAIKKCTQPLVVSKPNAFLHSGITGQVKNTNYTIGSLSLMKEKGILTKDLENQLELAAGDSLVCLAKENKLIGYFIITDPLREDAKKTVHTLLNMRKEVHLCTGADETTALRYAKVLGIKKVYANTVATTLDSEDKSKPELIKLLKKGGHKVAMIGDAANDASAMAASNLGIAIPSQNSDEITQQNAGAIIQNGNLLPIASAFAISKQTVTNIKQNLFLSLGYNITAVLIAGGLLVGIGFTLNPAIGVALMIIQASLILLNVYRFKQQSLDHMEEKIKPKEEELTSSHSIMNQHTPRHQAKLTIEPRSLSISKEVSTKKESPYSFWSYLFPEPIMEDKANTNQPKPLNQIAHT